MASATSFYQVHEMFSTFQGEGYHAGVPATFIRLQGCNVGCSWCDAKRTWGPVLETPEYKAGRDSARVFGYGAIEALEAIPEGIRGVIASLFDDYAMTKDGLTFYFAKDAHEGYPQQEMIRLLQQQDLHPYVGNGTGDVCIAREQWQVFVDYFRPLTAETKLGIKARKTGEKLSVSEIMRFVEHAGNRHVVITGGEPLLWNLDPLLWVLRQRDHYTQLETSGQGGFKGDFRPNWITWSPKANLKYEAPPGFKMGVNEVKWVVDEYLPLEKVEETWQWLVEFSSNNAMPKFVMMPEGCPPGKAAIDRALEFARSGGGGWAWRVGARLQYAYNVR